MRYFLITPVGHLVLSVLLEQLVFIILKEVSTLLREVKVSRHHGKRGWEAESLLNYLLKHADF